MESNIPFDPKSSIELFVIEDDKFYGRLIHKYYDMQPEVIVSIYNDAESCLDQTKVLPNVILVDFHLYDPIKDNMDGDKAINSLKAKYPDAIIVMMSGDVDEKVKVSSTLNGAFQFILKNKETFSNIDDLLIRCRHLIAYNEKYKDAEFSD